MAWICLDPYCVYKVFSVSSELEYLVKQLMNFFIHLAPGYYLLMVVTAVVSFLLYFFYYYSQLVKGDYRL